MSLFYPKLFNEDLATVEREQPRLPEYIDSLKKTRGSSAPNRRERVQPTNPYCGTAEKTVQSDADLEAVPTSYMRSLVRLEPGPKSFAAPNDYLFLGS